MVAKDLLEILVCPACGVGARVTPDEGDQALACTRCGRRYPVRDGIPVMLVEEAILPATGIPGPAPGDAGRGAQRSP